MQCSECGLQLKDSLQLQQALKLHISRKPDCPFVTRHYSRCPTHPPKHPQYQSISARLDSFEGWPRKYVHQSPETLAAAGLFYIGSADRTTCFHCGVTLRDWSEEHDVVTMHKQYSTDCEFINQPDLIQLGVDPRPLPEDTVSDVCNTEFDTDTHLPEDTESDVVSDTTCGTTPRFHGGQTVHDSCKGHDAGDVVTDSVGATNFEDDSHFGAVSDSGFYSHGASPSDNTVTQLVRNMGFSLDEINRAEKRLAQRNTGGSVDVSELVESILSFNTETTDKCSSKPSSDRLLSGCRGNIHTASKTTMVDYTPPSRKHLQLKKENRRLRNQKTCHACGLSDVCILFLPCGHLVTCEKCAPHVSTCLTCKKAIVATVKTYLT